MVRAVEQEVAKLKGRKDKDAHPSATTERRVEELREALRKHRGLDCSAFFIMKKLFKKFVEAHTKVFVYKAKVKVVVADGAARITSLVWRYATQVEESLHQFPGMVAHLEELNPKIRTSSLLEGFPTPLRMREARGSTVELQAKLSQTAESRPKQAESVAARDPKASTMGRSY